MRENKVAKQCPLGRTVLLITIAGLTGIGIGCLAMWSGIHVPSLSRNPFSRETTSDPNFVIFLADDVGYGDFQVYGHPTQEWTGVDRMAKEGKRFTHFYTPVAACSPSRAAILTGRYPVRAGIFGQGQVFTHGSSGGLPRREVTIAEELKEYGYMSGITGKWHLGPYGDSVNEMGWAINEVLDHLVKLGIDSKTFALFLSDHGAVRRGCGEDGSNRPFRGEKMTTWEGGVRVPAVSWWPGVIEPNSVSHDVLSTLDILPTVVELASDSLVNEGHAKCLMDTPKRIREYIAQYSCEDFIQQDPPLMFNLESDIEEHIALNPKSQHYQKILTDLKKQMDIHAMSIEDVESEINKPILPTLMPCCDPPVCMCNYEE